MAKYRIKVAAATWTNIGSLIAAQGGAVIVRADTADFQLGRKATAPTAGVALTVNKGVMVIVKQGDTLVPWVYSTVGGYLEVDKIAATVILDGTGTT